MTNVNDELFITLFAAMIVDIDGVESLEHFDTMVVTAEALARRAYMVREELNDIEAEKALRTIGEAA